jgi:hypothetical protein
MRALRSNAAVVIGFVAASIITVVVESINGRLLYPELAKAAEGVTDREVVRTLLAGAPIGAVRRGCAGA